MLTLHAASGRAAVVTTGSRDERAASGPKGWWSMGSDVVGFDEIDATMVAAVGGKGAHLGELARMDGIRVPPGFCVTTEAFRRIVAPAIDDALGRLAQVGADDRAAIGARSSEVRRAIEAESIPDELAAAITAARARIDEHGAYAVRSSATAEDLPAASFAGQQDTYLNVVGPAAVIDAVRRCWASLFTERAVTYRRRNGFDDGKVHMAVVVQLMVDPDASGIVFTADPVTSNRTVVTIEASFGLGEALVSGLVAPDHYEVRDGRVTATSIATKQRALRARTGGGTHEVTIEPERQTRPALTDAQVVELADQARRIEAHLGAPQDIEWCLVDGGFQIVQSRPITTLFPIPEAPDDTNRVYLSVGHQQMMTDAMRPLGLSMWQLTAMAPMHEAGGRLFVDVTRGLTAPGGPAAFLAMLGQQEPLFRDALETVLDRDDWFPPLADPVPGGPTPSGPTPGGPPPGAEPTPIETDPAIVAALIERSQVALAALEREVRTRSGPARFDLLLDAFEEHKRLLGDPLSMQAIMAGMDATWWLNDHLHEWLGEKSAADALTLSAPGNVTSEMGLALLDVADAVRPHPEVVAFLEAVDDDGFLDQLPELAGGVEARAAIESWLERYGMRGVGEIDITRPRWRERPRLLVPLILDHVRLFEAGAATRRFERGRQQAEQTAEDLLTRLRALPDGERKAAETRRMIDRVRTFIGYREYPKYAIVSRSFVYKQAVLEEAERLVEAGVLAEVEDCFFLTFGELHEVVRTHELDDGLIRRRKEELATYQALTPPRVLTSDGEAISGAYRRDDVPPGALAGVGVSSGTVEGRARVIADPADARIEAGDILVTAFTDPSWTPLFVAVAGLVTEVGGLMTHGAVIAREYGLPAVVGVPLATTLIEDGRRIRVHGADGFVELLP